MAAPEHVPVAPLERTRSYTSPDAVPDAWRADRPADLGGVQPSGGLMGHQAGNNEHGGTSQRHVR